MNPIFELPPGSKSHSPSIASADAPASVDLLYARYCRALARWHLSGTEGNRAAVSEAYKRWSVAFLGEEGARSIIVAAARLWGVS